MKKTKAQILEGVDGISKSRIIGNNTVEYWVDDVRVIRLHRTDILSFYPGFCVYNSGGWKTPTTKERMNTFGIPGVRIYQDKGQWYIHTPKAESIFYDGVMVSDETLDIIGDIKEQDHKHKYIIKLLSKYTHTLKNMDTLPVPTNGDCWVCSLFDQDMTPGGKTTDTDHLINHLEETYIHGSLIRNALVWKGYVDPSFIFFHGSRDMMVRAVRDYFKAQLGLAR